MLLASFPLSFIARILIHLRNFVLYVLSTGPIPAHVGFIMDGHRRYARLKNKPRQDGHRAGFTVLRMMLEVCDLLGVKCVSLYAFSIENFKREKDEVDWEMKFFEEAFENGGPLYEKGIRVNVIGRRQLLPEYLQRAILKMESRTRHNTRFIINLYMPYTARDEILTAIQSTVYQTLRTSSTTRVTEHDIASNLMTERAMGNLPLDVLVRTSGVKRLSDFMLWQCCENTQIHFIDTYWPEFDLWDFVPVILEYQRKVWSRKYKGSK